MTSEKLVPYVGERIHLTAVERYDLTGFRLSWDVDNFGHVHSVEPEVPEVQGPMTRCNRWETCQVARECASGRPHQPDSQKDGFGKCYDHRPYETGGVATWGILAAESRTP